MATVHDGPKNAFSFFTWTNQHMWICTLKL